MRMETSMCPNPAEALDMKKRAQMHAVQTLVVARVG
jgi:hypothetical protein